MGLRWYKAVWADKTLKEKPASYRLAMLALAEFADDKTGQCWPSVETISGMISLQDRQTQRVLRSLQADGYIHIQTFHGRNHSNVYTIIEKGAPEYTIYDEEKVSHSTPLDNKKMSHSTPFSEEKVSSSTEKVSSSTIKGVLEYTRSTNDPPIEPSKTKTTNSGSASIEGWKNVQAAYEGNIGMFTPVTSELAQDAVSTYGAAMVVNAITEAVKQNVRKWSYVDGILKRWHANGQRAPTAKTSDPVLKTRFVNGREILPEGFRIVNVYGQEFLS